MSIGISHLRVMSKKQLKAMTDPVIVRCHHEAVAVLMTWERYQQIQAVLKKLREKGGDA